MSETNESLFQEVQAEVPVLPLPGAALREAREAHGYSLSDVSHAIKFSVRQLEALEHDDYSNLKGTTFVRGFVRSYARYLRLDETPLLQALEPSLPPVVAEVKAVESMDAEMPTQGADINSRRAYGVAVGVLLLGALAWFAIQGHAPSKPAADRIAAPAPETVQPANAVLPAATSASAPPVEKAASVAPAASATVAPAAAAPGAQVAVPPSSAAPVAPATAIPEANNPNERQLVLSFSAESWVEVRDAAQHVLFSGRSPAGSSQALHGKPPFQLVVGNAPAVKLRYEDRNIDLQPYTRVDVARLTLDDNTK